MTSQTPGGRTQEGHREGVEGLGVNVGPCLVRASSKKSIWLCYSGHPDCLGSLFKVRSSGRHKKILRGAPLKKIAGHRCPFSTYLNSLLKSHKPSGPCKESTV